MKYTNIKILATVSLLTLSGISLTVIGKGNPAYECPGGKTYPVTLTFDDGPNMALTPRVLDVLKENNVKATFFVLGSSFPGGKSNPANAKKYAILDREKNEGHYIGSHTYEHIAHNSVSAEKAAANISKAIPPLEDYLSPVLRLPYGAGSFRSSNQVTQAKNNNVMSLVKNNGFTHVGWDIDTNDWDAKKRPTLVHSMMKQICEQKGGIILFHDVQKNTVEHLDEWIKIIKEQGHTFVGLEHFKPQVTQKYKKQAPAPCPGKVQDFKEVEDLNKTVEAIIKKEE